MADYDSDEEKSQLEKLQYVDVKPGMFVSGWDDENDLIEEDKNPQGKAMEFVQEKLKKKPWKLALQLAWKEWSFGQWMRTKSTRSARSLESIQKQ